MTAVTYQGIPSITVGRDDVGLGASLKQDTTREIVRSAVMLSVSIQGASWTTAKVSGETQVPVNTVLVLEAQQQIKR